MTVSPIGIPTKPYNGGVFSLPHFKRFGFSGTLVRLNINWQKDYGAGDNLPALCVIASFLTGANAAIPQTFTPSAVYVNNLGSNVPIYIWFPDSQYEIVCPANSEGWFQVTTNSAIAWIFGLNFQTQFPVTNTILFTDVPVPNYVNNAVPETVSEHLSSLNIGAGGGANISQINILMSGSGYANGNLLITGGGGTGATAHGTIDEWGRFTSVQLLNGGNEDYTGSPVVTATASNAVTPYNGTATYSSPSYFSFNGTIWKWSQGTPVDTIILNAPVWNVAILHNAGAQVNYNNVIYQAAIQIPANGAGAPSGGYPWLFVGPVTPLSGSGGWLDSGIAINQSAQFFATLATPTPASAVQSTGFGPPALGDQNFARSIAITGTGLLFDNVFKSPFGSGFIYLTDLKWFCVLGSAAITAAIELIASDGTLAVGQVDLVSPGANSSPGLQVALRGNIRLDATKQWQIKCSQFTGAGTLTGNFMHTFTYNQQ